MTTSGATQNNSYGWLTSSETGFGRFLVGGLLASLFPPRCLLCGSATTGVKVLCKQCAAKLHSLEGMRCRRCQEALDDIRLDLCHSCGTRTWGFDLARSLGSYKGAWGDLVRALKFDGERAVARLLCVRLAAYLADEEPFGTIDVVTYVPMSRSDRRKRGFNQAHLLAQGIGRRIGISARRLLLKVRETPPQAALPASERRENLRGAFHLIRSGRGKVLLIDDIFTTGSTVEACAHTLKSGGHKEVFVLTVARA